MKRKVVIAIATAIIAAAGVASAGSQAPGALTATEAAAMISTVVPPAAPVAAPSHGGCPAPRRDPRRILQSEGGCDRYELEAEPFSFAGFQAPHQRLQGVNLPRHGTLYRGIKGRDQFPIQNAVRAMLGAKDETVGSYVFEWIRDGLMKADPVSDEAKQFLESHHIWNEFLELRNCRKHGYSREMASRYAADLLDKELKGQARHHEIEGTLLNYDSQSFENFQKDTIFSSIFNPLAAHYAGNTVITFTDPKARSIDLNYWNYVNHGKWLEGDQTAWVDTGEFLMPGYIPGTDVKGIEMRSPYDPSQSREYNLDHTSVSLSFDQVKIGDRTYVLVFDGRGHQTLVRSGERVYYGTRFTDYQNPVAAPPVAEGYSAHDEPPLVAVIAACDPKAACDPRPEVLKRYPKTIAESIPAKIAHEIEAQTVDGLPIRIFPAEKGPTTIQIVDATYGGTNVTQKAQSFCGGKRSCHYLVSSRFLGDPAPGKPKSFKIAWKCDADSAEVHTKEISADATNEEFMIHCDGK